jgi:MFS family permease
MSRLAVGIPERLARPLRSAAFRRLALGKSISFLGDWLMVAVLVGWIYESTSSVAEVALLMAVRLVPPIVGGGIAASVCDRLPRLKVLVCSELVCAATIAGALAAVVAGSRTVVFALVGICSLVSTISSVAGSALIPQTVEAGELAGANAVHSVGQEAAMALGALVGGVTVAVGGPVAGLAANLASYGVAVLLYSGIRVADAERAGAVRSGSGRRRGGLVEGLRYVLAQRTLAVVVCGFAAATLAAGLVNATLPKFTAGLGLGSAGYGLALAALALGMIVGEALTGAVAERIEPRWLGAALAAMGCLCLAFALTGNPFAALSLFTVFGIVNGVAEVVLMTVIHEHADAAFQGRVFGVGAALWRTTMLGAVALAPVVDALASPARAISVAAGVLVVGGVVVHTLLRPVGHPAPATA